MELKWWLTPIIAVALSGCLHESDDDAVAGQTESETVAGKAADGYLYGATACLDINENKVCDPTEPSASTGPNGDFSISATPSDAAKPIVVEIVVGTIDQDDPSNPITQAYTITAPAGYDFVSPLTTLVQNEIEASGVSADDAEAAIKALLDTTLPLDQDYIAGAAATGSDLDAAFADEFEKLHKVARVAAAIIQNNVAAVTASGTSVDTGAAFELIVAKVATAVEDIVEEVEQVIVAGTTFNPDAIAAVDTIAAATDVDVATLVEELAIAEDIDNASAVNMGTILAGGVYFLETDYYTDFQTMMEQVFFGYGLVSYDGITEMFKFYYYNGTDFVLAAEDPAGEGVVEEDFLTLIAAGFTAVAEPTGDGPNFSSVNADGSVTADFGIFQVKFTAEEIDISNKKISTTLANTGNWLWADAVGNTATFPASSSAYRLQQTLAQTVYGLPYELVSTDGSDDCTADDAFGTTTPSCNAVRYIDGASGVLGSAAPDTVDFVVGSAATSADVMKSVVVYVSETTTDQEPETLVLAELISGGSVRFTSTIVGSASLTVLATGTYTTEIVHGKTLLVFEIPSGVPNFFADSGDGPQISKIFLVKHDGFWRYGVKLEAGSALPDDAPFVMNETALNAATAAFDPVNIDLGGGDVNVITDPDLVD